VLCSEFVTNLFQESFCHFLLLLWPVQCFFCIPVCLLVYLTSNIFYRNFSLFLFIVLFGQPKFLNIFSYFASLLFLNFNLLLILVSFVKFSIPSQRLFQFPLYCLTGVSLSGCTAVLCFRHLAILI